MWRIKKGAAKGEDEIVVVGVFEIKSDVSRFISLQLMNKEFHTMVRKLGHALNKISITSIAVIT